MGNYCLKEKKNPHNFSNPRNNSKARENFSETSSVQTDSHELQNRDYELMSSHKS